MNELKKGKRADRVRAVIPYVGLLLVVLIFGVWSKGELFDGRNLIPVFNNCFNIMFAAIGLTFVLSQGTLDLSIGGVVTFCGKRQPISAAARYAVAGAFAGVCKRLYRG